MKRKTLQNILHFVLRTLTHTEFVGTENIPPQGGVIFVVNHMSRVDAPILFGMPVREDTITVAADKYKKIPIFRFLVETAESIWINRESADFTAMNAAIESVNQGRALGVAPEGTRSSSGHLNKGKSGAVFIADKTRAPIVPVGIAGSESAVKKLLSFRRPHIIVRFGKPFMLPPMDRTRRDAWLQSCTDEIMCRIAAELPPQYHGFYADHPRLRELLGE
jgi:1-acyl-sn-glycerol-3-phosphate acyltransferase